MSRDFTNTHSVKWTQNKINNFWRNYTTVRMKHRPELNWYPGAYDRLHVEMRKYVPKNSYLLDVGCGGGYSVAELTKEDFNVIGLESDKHQLKLCVKYCKKNKVKANVIRGLAWNLPFADNSFDSVYCCELLEHVIPGHLSKVMKEIHRVLKYGGYYFALVPKNEDMFQNMALCPDCGAWFHRHQHFQDFGEEKLRQLLEKSKFEIIKLFPCAVISDLTADVNNTSVPNPTWIIGICQKKI